MSEKAGRRTIGIDRLRKQRDGLAFLFDTYWGDIGWAVECLRGPGKVPKVGDVQKAFAPLRDKQEAHRIPSLVRTSTTIVKPKQVRETRSAFMAACKAETDAQTAYQSKLNVRQEADAALYQLSSEHSFSLQQDLKRRTKNIRELKRDRQKWERALRNFRHALKRPAEKEHVNQIKVEYERSKQAHEQEIEILRQIRQRLALINPTNTAIAKALVEKRGTELADAERELGQATQKRRQIENVLRDQEAGFSQTELIRFSRQRIAAHDPKRLANAVAGLPEIGCRVSFRRCQKLLFPFDDYINHRLFRFIQTCLRKSRSRSVLRRVEFFRSEVQKLPKRTKTAGNLIDNFLRQFLHDNWPELRDAVSETTKTRLHPREAPYVILASFNKNRGKPKTMLELMLRQQKGMSS